MNIEGRNAVLEALNNDVKITKIYLDEKYIHGRENQVIYIALKRHIKLVFMPKPELDKISKSRRHQGYVAEVGDFEYCSLEDIMIKSQGHDPFVLLLDGIEDPHNLGAIIRTAECAGVDGVVIPKNRACPVNETVIKTSVGAVTNMLVCQVTNLKEAIEFFKKQGLWIYSAELGGQDIYKTDLSGPIGLVIGSEGNGTHKTVQEHCDGVVTLPLYGKVNSLNASVSAGIVIYETLRQRENKGK